jgi:NTP pyrophosphatase (non-canonical NTP hydrolase)
MAMHSKGLTKLIEECSELIQVAAKKSAYINGPHPDGGGSLDMRMEDEMGDVLAAIEFVTKKFNLSEHDINARCQIKLNTYRNWDKE